MPTDDLIVAGERGATPAVKLPFDDNHPHAMVGGGDLNLTAGTILCGNINPDVVACEFGARSNYLLEVGGPMGSAVYADIFRSKLNGRNTPHIEVYDEAAWEIRGSGTVEEIHNLFTLAVRRNLDAVHLVVGAVHSWRTTLIAHRWLMTEPAFKGLLVKNHMSEYVLLDSSADHEERVHRIFSSRAYQNNLALEQFGVNKLLAGDYTPHTSIRG